MLQCSYVMPIKFTSLTCFVVLCKENVLHEPALIVLVLLS